MMHRNNRWFWTANFGLLALAFLILSFVEKGDAVLFFSNHRQAWANTLFPILTKLAEPPGYALAFILLLFLRFRFAFSLLLVALAGLVFSFGLKNYFAQPRPWAYFSQLQKTELLVLVPDIELHTAADTSFPSGHSLSAFALFTVVALAVRPLWLKLLCLLAAASVALSRMYLVQHFLEDVCVGALLGSAIGYGIFIFQKIYLNYAFLDRKLGKPLKP